MSCREFWNRMPELEAGDDQLAHLRECPACVARLEHQRMLAAGLRHLAEKRQDLAAPPQVEAELLTAFRNHMVGSAPALPYRWMRRSPWIPAAAACLLVMGVVAWGVGSRASRVSRSHIVQFASIPSADAADEGFIPLPSATETPSAEDADLVRVQVPRSVLIALGVPLAEGSGDAVEAEILLGAGGAPEAVRVLQ
jgi:anti-sigma factor RsiW